MQNVSVTIRVSGKTREILKKLKKYRRETYDEVISRLIKLDVSKNKW